MSVRPLSPGEQTIRRAFRRSLLVVGLVAAAMLAWWALPSGRSPAPVDETALALPPGPAADQGGTAPPPLQFTDITEAAGIDFVHVNGAYGERLLPETMGSGAAFFDYDGDGDQDLYLVNSNTWPGHGDASARPALYRNDGRGRFSDVTAAAGLDRPAYGMGVAVGDYDNDGRPDLFLSNLGRNRLLRNLGGRFEDVTSAAGVAGGEQDWSTAAAFFDTDDDGDLDLYVGNYVEWSRAIDLKVDFQLSGLGRAYGAPTHFAGAHGTLYRNDGKGRFSDISAAAGIRVSEPHTGAPVGKTLGVLPVDYDGDGRMDLLVANDTVRNLLFRNLGGNRFQEVGRDEGIAYDRDGKATGAMGVDAAWFRNDRDLAFAIGNFANEMSSLFVTTGGRAPFADEAVLAGLGPASRQVLTFGLFFFDADLDGWLDLLQANGHLEQEINRVQSSQHYAQPAQLLWNCPSCRHRFRLHPGPGDLAEPRVGRGAAYADIDGDGDLDVLITSNGGRPALLRNDQRLDHHWLRLKLVGARANRDAIGARVELSAGGSVQRRQVMPSRSYLSQVELPLTFGLGDADRVDSLRIRWPGGRVQEVPVDAVDRAMTIRQD